MKFCDPSFFSISKDRLFCSSFQRLPLFMATEDENSIQERYGEYRNSKTALVLGVRMPPFYVKGFKDFIENFQTRHDDVFIVGFPRSGELIILSKSETKTKNFQKYFVMKTRPQAPYSFWWNDHAFPDTAFIRWLQIYNSWTKHWIVLKKNTTLVSGS